MNYKYILVIFFSFITSCSTYTANNNEIMLLNNTGFKNKGFALIYNDKLYKKKNNFKKNER